MKGFIFVCVFCLPLFAGCANIGPFTVMSTNEVDWSRANEYVVSTEMVTGEDLTHVIIFVPLRDAGYLDKAIQDALDKIPGAVALSDVMITRWDLYFPPVYGLWGFTVKGYPVIDPKLAGVREFQLERRGEPLF